MTRLSPLLSRLLAVMLLIGAGLAVHLAVVEPLRQRHMALDESIALSQELLQRFAKETGDPATLTRQREALSQQPEATAGLLRGDNETIAGAFVQSFLTSTVERGGGTVRSVQVLPVRDERGLRKVTARAQLHTTSAALRDILHRLEGNDPYLFIDNLDIRRTLQPRPEASDEEEVELLVRFDVYGFLAAKPAMEERS
ncbi:type II secretion system protein GspM [Pelagibius sp. CAU 1746]|uniref:type II secretion system protein GspM n=1 Tax=Pelagibius sp. CAU 1746 TaxID=3140370 RepID=UPI00325A5446